MTSPFAPVDRARRRIADLLTTLHDWPWMATLATLRQRFREDHLSLTASSLTFTTLFALVPLVTVAFAVLSIFPLFADLRGRLESQVLPAFMPAEIAKPVLAALTRFADRALAMGGVSVAVLLASALVLLFTIDGALNAIWRVRRPRPLGQRVLVYWAALTLGPLVLAVSVTASSWALSAAAGWVGPMPGLTRALLAAFEFGLLAATMAGLYHYLPNTDVRWRHAWAGGLFVALGIELAKQALGWYVRAFPANAAIYGAAAALPVFLLWIYTVWAIVLLGAVIAAYAPSLSMRVARRPPSPGDRFELALVLLRELALARSLPARGWSLPSLAYRLRLDPLQIEPVLDTLIALDWVGRLDEGGDPRHVLACDPTATPVAPLVDALLLAPTNATAAFREKARVAQLTLADVMG
jgi:membrane protein